MKEYFSHDYNTTLDPKIIALLGDYGAIGYGIYWRIVEMLHSENEHKLPLKEYIYKAIAKQMLTSVEQISTIINDCINVYELFIKEDDYFYSQRVNKNLKKQIKNINKRMFNYDVKKWYLIINEVFKRDNYTCQYCGTKGGKLEADHIIPFSKGGRDSLDNLTTSCRRCNRQKKDKSIEEFKMWREKNGTTYKK